MTRPIHIAPSVLPADHSRFGEECVALENAGADRIQWDVMDGVFVPNLTFGPDLISAVRPHVSLPFEAHLMVVEPDRLLARYVQAGCEIVIVHIEACEHLHRTLTHIADLGATPGVAINPHTPPHAIEHVLDLLGIILVMTVNPGFGGQAYIKAMESKIAAVSALIADREIDLEVDGGIGPSTIAGAAASGANVFVSGSALYKEPAGLASAIADLRTNAQAAQK